MTKRKPILARPTGRRDPSAGIARRPRSNRFTARTGVTGLAAKCIAGALAAGAMLLGGCVVQPWNDPYPREDAGRNVLYASFRERPKHMDPARSYSANEYELIAQIYEPPLQYHYLLRPYTLVALTAQEVPVPRYLDRAGGELPPSAPAEAIERSVYEIRIRPGIRFQPHPAFARDARGEYLYHRLDAAAVRGIRQVADFPRSGDRELTAADYVYQIKRLAHPELHSPILGLMSEYVVGLAALAKRLEAAARAGAPLDLRDAEIEGAEVVDRYTYRIEIHGKYPQFVYWLAMPFFAPVPWEADRFYGQTVLEERNVTLDWYPVGTGPYMLVENNPSRRITLERNPRFRGESYPSRGETGDAEAGLLADARREMPFIDRAVYSLEKESIPYWNKFLQGYYDASGVSSDSFDQAVMFSAAGLPEVSPAMREHGIRLETATTTSIYYTGFNMLDPVVGGATDRARWLRRAISVAVDIEEYVSIFANGRGIPAQGPLPPGISGHREGQAGHNPFVYQWADGASRRRPIEEAHEMMRRAGYVGGRDVETGEPLVLHFDSYLTGPDAKARLDWLRKQFAKIGIQLDVRATDYNRFQEKMRKGTAQIYQWGWNADYPDPENFFFLLYGPNSKVQAGGENASNYANPDFDRLFERMKNMDDGSERRAIIEQMTDIVRRDAPWLWGFHPQGFELYHSWYHNTKPNLMANNTLKYARIDPRRRVELRASWNRPVVWPVVALGLVLALVVAPAFAVHRRRERALAT